MPTSATSPRPIRMFVAYAREDDAFRRELIDTLGRLGRGEARVVPMVVRSCDGQSTRLAKLQVIPRGGTPLSKYSDPDDFWLDVRNELKAVVRELQKLRGHAAAHALA